MRRSVRATAWVLLAGLLLAVLATASRPQPAFAKSFSVDKWSAHYAVQKNGDVRVDETQAVRFNGRYSFYNRTIPINRFDALTDIAVHDDTNNVKLDKNDVDVTKTESEGFDAANIRINFKATDEVKTWTISYTAKGAVGFFEDHDELYWNVIPHDREVVINAVEATVELPGDVGADKIRLKHYEDGVANVRESVVNGTTAQFSTGAAAPSTDFTIVVGWPTGLVRNPGIVRVESTLLSGAAVIVDGEDTGLITPVGLRNGRELTSGQTHRIQVQKYGITSEPTTVTATPGQVTQVKLSVLDTPAKWILAVVVAALFAAYALLPLWVALFLWLRWRKTGRDPKGQGTIVAQFEPPPPDDPKHPDQPGVVGTLIDERADLKDLTASIVDLAVRGYLVIEELTKKHSWTPQDYKLTQKKSWYDDSSLQPYEKDLLVEVFGGSDERTLSDLKNKFYVNAPRIQTKLYDEVVERGYFLINPDKRRKAYYGVGTLLLVLGFFGTTFMGLGIPLLATGFVVMLFGRGAPQRTRSGVLAREHALGFKEYLFRAERYVVRKMTPETFERFLPYAMVFGVEQQWARRFKDIYVDREPTWYRGASGSTFNAILLANAMTSWSTASSTTMASRPSSSGSGGSFSSGSSGFSGGFSGGGGGGGGISAG